MEKHTKSGAAAKAEGQRKRKRHPVHWRVAIVRKVGARNDIYHGRTHDLSMAGASVLAEKNIFVEEPVVVLLAIPPEFAGQSERIVEIRCRMFYTVLSADEGLFRIGMKFLEFKGDGRKHLLAALSKRVVPDERKVTTVQDF